METTHDIFHGGEASSYLKKIRTIGKSLCAIIVASDRMKILRAPFILSTTEPGHDGCPAILMKKYIQKDCTVAETESPGKGRSGRKVTEQLH